MTEEELEQKAIKECGSNDKQADLRQAFKDGFKQGQEDFDSKVTKLLNSYGVKFIDTNSIGGLIALHQLMLELEQENEELKQAITDKNSEVEKGDEKLWNVSHQLEELLKLGKDKGMIKNWYTNGTYHWEFAE